MQNKNLVIFGEALFDCFPDGASVLGGAPFNVAWHLQAFGDAPQFISRVGQDDLGEQILHSMRAWGMQTDKVQQDTNHATGQVNITIENDEPHYDIAIDAAYDFIDYAAIIDKPQTGLFYHGTLAARQAVSARALEQLTQSPELQIFIDVNLRDPWWNKADVFKWIERASWVKLNQDELETLGFKSADLHQDMTRMHSHFHLQHLIVTCGEKGAIVRDEQGEFHQIEPQFSNTIVDTVGAGDAFSAMYIHGLLADWTVDDTLEKAQSFASKVVGVRGAISEDPDFYQM